MTTPMLQALRSEWLGAHVTVVAGSLAAGDVIRNSNLCDQVKTMSFRTASTFCILTFFFRLRFEHYDAALVATRLSPKIAFLLRFLSGLKVVAGDGVGKRGRGYTHWRRTNFENHRSQDNIQILKLLAPHVESSEDSLPRLHLQQALGGDMEAAWHQHRLEGHAVMGVHPGCGVYEQDKKLPEQWCWEIISRFLLAFPEAKVALFFGPEDSLFGDGPENIMEKVVRFQRLPLSTVAALIERTNVFLCGDSGLGHVAAAVGVPVVTVAGPTRINQTRPVGKRNLVVKTEQRLPCMPCFETPLFSNCPISQTCMTTVSAQRVVDAIAEALKGPRT